MSGQAIWLPYEYSTAIIDSKPVLLRRGGNVQGDVAIEDLAWHPVMVACEHYDIDLVKRVARLLNGEVES